METVTFYSYKGGVGRSVAVSHIAERFAELEQSVFIIDFDLEAPGLHYKFKNEIAKAKKKQGIKKGLVDYLYNFFVEKNKSKIPEDFSDYFYDFSQDENPKGGKIFLMPAGDFESGEYWNKLSTINWKKDFLDDERIGIDLLLDLKGRIQKTLSPDYLLIDSRTGISDIATLTLKVLADKIVVVAVNNDENLDGSINILQSLNLPDNKWSDVKRKLFFALSRLPYAINSIEDQKEKEIVEKVKAKFVKGFIKPINFVILHEDRELVWGEKNISQLNGRIHLPIKEDYLKLLSALTRNTKHLGVIKKIHDYERAKGYFDDALLLYKNENKLDEAQRTLQQAIHLYPKDSNLYGLSANIYYFQNKYQECINAINNEIRLSPNSYSAYNNRGLAYLNLNMPTHAIKDFTKSIQLYPELFNAYYNRAFVYSSQANGLDKSNNDLSKAIMLNPNESGLYEFRANNFIGLGKYKNAIADSNKILDIDIANPNGYFIKAQALFGLRKFRLATINYTKAIHLNPDRPDYYIFRALSYESQGNNNRAIKDYDKAIHLKSKNSRVYYLKARLLFLQKKYTLAIVDITNYIQFNKKPQSDGYNLRGAINIKLENYNDAILDYSKAIKFNPKDHNSFYNRAILYRKQDKLKQALRDLSKSISLEPKEYDFYIKRADIYAQTGKNREAIIDLKKAIELKPRYYKAFLERSEIYERIKNYKKALLDLNYVISLKGNNSDLYNKRAMLFLKYRKYTNALTDAKKAIRLSPNSGYAYSTLAEIYFAKKNKMYFYKYLEIALKKGFKLTRHINDFPYKKLKKDEKFLVISSISHK